MGMIYDWFAQQKDTPVFTKLELRNFLIAVFVFGFVMGFNDGRFTRQIDGFYVFNMIASIIIVAISFFIHFYTNKAAALSSGYRVEFKIWSWGLLLAIVIAILTNGRWWFILPGGIFFYHLAGRRLGYFRYGMNYWGVGIVSISGCFTTMLFAMFLKMLFHFTQNPFIYKAFIFNVLLAVYMVLPIPPAHGIRMFFGSRMMWALMFCFIVAAAVLLVIDIPIIIAFFGSILIGLVGWLLYYVIWEKDNWLGP